MAGLLDRIREAVCDGRYVVGVHAGNQLDECGYDLTGAAANRCPECGTPFPTRNVVPSKPGGEADE
ncbi:MAG: hypothetical protein ACPMAQ_00695 [Phycisphaerae bacterium]